MELHFECITIEKGTQTFLCRARQRFIQLLRQRPRTRTDWAVRVGQGWPKRRRHLDRAREVMFR